MTRRPAIPLLVALSALGLAGCSSHRSTVSAGRSFFTYDFPAARDVYRPLANQRPLDKNSLLDNVRLGMAAEADGDTTESVRALNVAYQLLESGNVNDEGRILAATVLSDGVTVYKGEPFEQAFAYTALAYANALKGDWENVRICARATVRKLYDFETAKGESSGKLDQAGVKLVETDFTLGYLLQAIADRVIGEESPAMDQALSLDSRLRPLAEQVKSGRFNCVLVVEAGHGPRKEAFGPDDTLTRWRSRDALSYGQLRVLINGAGVQANPDPVTNVDRMAADHRWINLEESRKVKSALGTGLLVGGAGVAAISHDRTAQAAGLGALLAGLIVKSTSAADTRYNDLLPNEVYVALLDLPPEGATVDVSLTGDATSHVVLPMIRPASASAPAMIYLRVFRTLGTPAYLTAPAAVYANDAEPPVVGDYPYILGGHSVATPTPEALRTYQRGGHLIGVSLDELRELYAGEGIQIGAGAGSSTPGDPAGLSAGDGAYRHVLEGGHALFTPAPGTIGYKRIMCAPHAPYVPASPRVQELLHSSETHP